MFDFSLQELKEHLSLTIKGLDATCSTCTPLIKAVQWSSEPRACVFKLRLLKAQTRILQG